MELLEGRGDGGTLDVVDTLSRHGEPLGHHWDIRSFCWAALARMEGKTAPDSRE
jgi:hypothetical protein